MRGRMGLLGRLGRVRIRQTWCAELAGYVPLIWAGWQFRCIGFSSWLSRPVRLNEYDVARTDDSLHSE
jgi:hypothetical protein